MKNNTYSEIEKELEALNPSMEEIEEVSKELEDFKVDEEDKTIKHDNSSNCILETKDFYLGLLRGVKLCTPEEEEILGKKILAGGKGAEAARKRLTEGNLRFAYSFAKRYAFGLVDIMDINSMAALGMTKAAYKFDYRKGYKFTTYAAWWMKKAITVGLSLETSSFHMPQNKRDYIVKLKKEIGAYTKKYGYEPTATELAEFTSLPVEAVEEAYRTIELLSVTSLDAATSLEENDVTLAEVIKDEKAVDPCEAVIASECHRALETVLDRLAPREAAVLKLRNGFDDGEPKTLDEIGAMWHLSRERIRAIEKKALVKIRRSPSMVNSLSEFYR